MLKNLLIFLAGAGVGSAVTWYIVKNRYEEIANEEIEDVKEYYSSKYSENIYEEDYEEQPKVAENRKIEKPSLEEVRRELDKKIAEYGYAQTRDIVDGYFDDSETDPAEEEYPSEYDEPVKGMYPYIIEPNEYGEKSEYETKSLILYEDGYIADSETDELVQDVETSIGWENVDEMGKYEDDAIHICNDVDQVYYEILRSEKKYYEGE